MLDEAGKLDARASHPATPPTPHSPPPPLHLRLLLLFLLLSSLPSTRSLPWPLPPPYTPSSPLFPSTPCDTTFASFDRALPIAVISSARQLRDSFIPNFPWLLSEALIRYQSVAALCPANCTQTTARTPARPAVVYGSFPYHGQSSVCLAAVHAGIIDDSVGGGVFVSRFYRHDWSNSSTQSIFPFTSAMGTLSNGVHSRDVDSSWYTVPSNASEWSYTVRDRGDPFVQRRTTPFPPRADHLQLLLTSDPGGEEPQVWDIHVIVGGYNGTHYLNDVWCGVQLSAYHYGDYTHPLPTTALSSDDLTWTRMADAPFTPRSQMAYRAPAQPGMGEVHWLELDPLLLIVGGQTNHSCGLYELGVCSDEVWQLNLTLTPAGTPTTVWSSAPVWHLPLSPARCQAGLLMSSGAPTVRGPAFDDRLLWVGGQWSYSNPACTSPPVTTNDVWGARLQWSDAGVAITDWTRQADAPFTPRRLDMSCHTPLVKGGVDFPCVFIPGPTHLSLSPPSSSPGHATLSSSLLFADLYAARFNASGLLYWLPEPPSLIPRPSDGLPLPTASSTYKQGGSNLIIGMPDLSFGGRLAASSLRQWRLTPPRPDPTVTFAVDYAQVQVNVSVLPRQRSYATQQAFLDDRLGLPLTAQLDEAELNDEGGGYRRGVGCLSFASSNQQLPEVPNLWSFREQTTAFITHPAQSTFFSPLPASSLNTSRPRLNFPLARHSHRATTPAIAYQLPSPSDLFNVVDSRAFTTAGQTSSLYHNDLIHSLRPRCLPPVDPSFAVALGPLTLTPLPLQPDNPNWNTVFVAGTFTVSLIAGTLGATCVEGWHWEPPTADPLVRLQCGPDGMWVDTTVLSVRRCVQDRLNCTWPLADLGGLWCEPAPTLVQQLHASYVEGGILHVVTEADAVTLTDFPLTAGATLSIYGSVFWEGAAVSVGQAQCAGATLLPSVVESDSGLACYNVSAPGMGGGGVRRQCLAYSRWVRCTMPEVLGVGMRVSVTGGRADDVPEVDSSTGRTEATVTSMSPFITGLSVSPASSCTPVPSQPLVLTDCAVTAGFNLTLELSEASVGSALHPSAVFLLGPSTWAEVLRCVPEREVPVGVRRFLCEVYPRLGVQVVRVLQPVLGATSQQAASLSFQSCSAGTSIDYEALVMGNVTSLCRRCPPGTSTNNNTALAACVPCAAGSHSNVSGAAICDACTPGTVAPEPGLVSCQRCPPNSYANSSAQTRCEVCELNQYLVVGDEADVGVAGVCVECPGGASCSANGTIRAQSGSYLLISQAVGTISTAVCASVACISSSNHPMGSAACSGGMPTADAVLRSQLSVVNCCAQGRWPAVVSDPQLYSAVPSLRISQGRNVLCATCLPGHTQLSGRCIPCDSAHAGAITLLLLVALLLTYALHRLPHDWTGRARLSILTNFLQLVTLFLSMESWPQVAALLHLTLMLPSDVSARTSHVDGWAEGDGRSSSSWMCVAPMTDGQRMLVTLLSPLLGAAVLGLIAVLQITSIALLTRCCARRPPRSQRRCHRLYTLVFMPSEPSGRARKQPQQQEGQEHTLELAEPLTPSGGVAARSAAVPPSISLLPYQRSAVRLLLLSYTGLTMLSLSFFHWQDVGDFGHRLYDYPALWPDAAEYSRMRPAMLAIIIVVVVGVPLALTALLAYHHRKGHLTPTAAAQPGQERLEGVEEQGGGASAAPPSSGPPLQLHVPHLLLQLTAMYRPSCWWMAPFVLLRKALVVAAFTLVTDAQVWVYLTLLLTLALAFHQHVQPYARRKDNDFETATHLSLLTITSLLSIYPPPYISAGLLSVFNALVLAPLLPMLLERLLHHCRAWRAGVAEAEAAAALGGGEAALAADAVVRDGRAAEGRASPRLFRSGAEQPTFRLRQPLLVDEKQQNDTL